jgi:CheY-like chemotaxis protein
LSNSGYPVDSMTDTSTHAHVAAVTADMIFAARIRGAAQVAGTAVRFARNAGELQDAAAGARLVLLDLDARWVDVSAVMTALKDDERTATATVVAFVSHVRVDAIEAAQAAGVDRVLARSAFVRELPSLLRTPDPS